VCDATRGKPSLKILLTIILVSICTAVVVGITTLGHLNSYQRDLGKLRSEFAAASERLARVESNVASATSLSANTAAPRRQENRLKEPSLTVTTDEIAVIRRFIKLPPRSSSVASTISLGDTISEARLLAMPDVVVDKIPKLRGTRFTTDRNHAIIIVGQGGTRADAIISAVD
jgi:hypothetical protein